MTITNQDRDRQITYNHTDTLQIAAVYYGTTYMGTNIFLHGELLGTFDTHQEAISERDTISSYPHEIYVVSGSSPTWEDWETLCGMMAHNGTLD